VYGWSTQNFVRGVQLVPDKSNSLLRQMTDERKNKTGAKKMVFIKSDVAEFSA
jgi:hypothetical protein